jgi:hypothetical protein
MVDGRGARVREGHEKDSAHTDLLRGRASGSFLGQRRSSKRLNRELKKGVEFPGYRGQVVVPRDEQRKTKERRQREARGGLGTAICGLAHT